jgi:hypothetical protein
MDRFAALIKKQNLMNFPEGREIQGVIHEFTQNHKENAQPYIQNIFQDADDIMIICFYDEQAQILLGLTSFEIDMSFKRIKTKGLNEVVLASYMIEHGKGKSSNQEDIDNVLIMSSNDIGARVCQLRDDEDVLSTVQTTI